MIILLAPDQIDTSVTEVLDLIQWECELFLDFKVFRVSRPITDFTYMYFDGCKIHEFKFQWLFSPVGTKYQYDILEVEH